MLPGANSNFLFTHLKGNLHWKLIDGFAVVNVFTVLFDWPLSIYIRALFTFTLNHPPFTDSYPVANYEYGGKGEKTGFY